MILTSLFQFSCFYLVRCQKKEGFVHLFFQWPEIFLGHLQLENVTLYRTEKKKKKKELGTFSDNTEKKRVKNHSYLSLKGISIVTAFI